MPKAPEPPKTLAKRGCTLWRRTLTEHESGCDVAQGFLLSRPMPVDDLPRFLAAVADISLSRSN